MALSSSDNEFDAFATGQITGLYLCTAMRVYNLYRGQSSLTTAWNQKANETSMSVLLIVGPKFTLAASHAAPWRVTVSILTKKDGRTDARPPDAASVTNKNQKKKTVNI